MARKSQTKAVIKAVKKTTRSASEDRKAVAIERRRRTLAVKRKVEETNAKLATLAESIPDTWAVGSDKVELMRTIHRNILGLTKKGEERPVEDLRLFFVEAVQRNLNPFRGQIHAVYIYDSSIKGEKLVPVTGINGYVAIAQRTNKFAGFSETRFEDYEEDGKYPGYPKKAVVDMFGYNPVTGEREIVTTATVWFEEYVPLVDTYDEDGNKTGKKRINSTWSKRPRGQLEKCAQALAIRRMFPEDTGGLYVSQEIEHLQTATPEEDINRNEDDMKNRIAEELAKRRLNGGVFEAETVEAK